MKKISLLLAASAIFAGASYAEDITSEVVKKEALTVKYGETINVIGSDAKLIFDPSIPSGWEGGVQYALEIQKGAAVNVLNGGLIDMNSVKKDFKVIRASGLLNVDSGTVRTDKITLGDSAEFILSQANAISASSLAATYLTFGGGSGSCRIECFADFRSRLSKDGQRGVEHCFLRGAYCRHLVCARKYCRYRRSNSGCFERLCFQQHFSRRFGNYSVRHFRRRRFERIVYPRHASEEAEILVPRQKRRHYRHEAC